MSLENVISPQKRLPGGSPKAFPAYYWKPDGTKYVVNNETEIQEGSTPFHPKSADAHKPPPAPKPVELPLTKAEVVQHLTDGEIPFKANASHKSLYELLLAGVKNALTEAKIAFDPDSTDAKALLELFPKD